MSNGAPISEFSSVTSPPVQPPSVIRLLRRRFLAILIPVLVTAAAGLAVSLRQEKTYEASTSVLFSDAALDVPALSSTEPAREFGTNLDLLENGLVLNRVRGRLNRSFRGAVDVAEDGENTHLATVTVSSSDPEQAARVANAYVSEYILLRQEIVREQYRSEREALRGELSTLSAAERARGEAASLRSRLGELAIADLTPNAVKQITRAKPPSSASAPKPLQNTLIGAMVGLALGLALAIYLERRDRRVRDPRYMQYVLGRPIIGRIPRSRAIARSGPGTEPLPPAETEAFRTMRANLRQQLRAQNTRSVLVTSAIPGEGKTTVVWNLARLEAAAGSRVLLVEADMRRPVLAQSLGENGVGGLSELLAGKARLQDLVHPIGFEDQAGANGEQEGGLDVLFAGSPPADPAELLDSERMQAVLEVVADGYDLVVLDTPPAVVSDAMPILDRVGGVLVVGRLGLSTGESLAELREQLDRLDAPTVGVVVNGASGRSDPYHYYASTGGA
jgi:polysaccharide biosynthesis transport protein